MSVTKFQLGKKGLSKEFIESLRNAFNGTDSIRLSLLKSSTRDRDERIQIADEIISKLGKGKYTCKIIGYTIILKKWRKPRKI
jgi:RNA-binding protein YhbY